MKNSLIGGGTAAVTTGTGLTQLLSLIPDDIGKLACLVGILASFGVILAQASNIWLTIKSAKKLEMEITEMKKRV